METAFDFGLLNFDFAYITCREQKLINDFKKNLCCTTT